MYRCFADTQPRIFDTSSLQILANFSELVTRELEKDIALAQQQQQREQAAAADRQQQYDLLLRTADCVTSAVLLVDTSKPDWPIVHANSGWDRLSRQCYRPLLLPSWRGSSSSSNALSSGTIQNNFSGSNTLSSNSLLNAISGSSNSSNGGGNSKSRHMGYWAESTPVGPYGSSGGSSSSASGVFVSGAPTVPSEPINCCFADVTTPLNPAVAGCPDNNTAAAAASSGENAGASSSSSSDKFPAATANGLDSSSSIIGMSLWSLVDQRLLQQITNSSSSSGSNALVRAGSTGLRNSGYPGLHNHGVNFTPGEQVVEQVKGRQSFTLRGIKLAAHFGAGTAQLTFR